MLNVFKLNQRINESAAGGSIGTIEPYKFIGTMDEATAEFNAVILGEAVNFSEYYAGAQEIMTEAAASNSDLLNTISENVFTTIKEGIIKFFKKMKEVIKGMIEKLKAFFYKLTGKTTKWASVMKPRIEAAKRNSGTSDITYEMHKWDVDFITKGMVDGVKTILKNKTSDNAVNALQSCANEIASYKGLFTGITKKKEEVAADPDNAKVKTAIETLDKKAEAAKTDKEKFNTELAGTFAGALGVSRDASLDAMYQAVAQKATGGEKVSTPIRSMIDNMLTAVEGAKNTISDLQKVYENDLKDFTDAEKKVTDALNKVEVEGKDTYATELVNAAKSALSAHTSLVTYEFSQTKSVANNIRGMNIKYINDMMSEYMGALGKFAGTKSKKDKE